MSAFSTEMPQTTEYKSSGLHWTIDQERYSGLSSAADLEALLTKFGIALSKEGRQGISQPAFCKGNDSIGKEVGTWEDLHIFHASEAHGHHPHHFIFVFEDRSSDWEDLSLRQIKMIARAMSAADRVLHNDLGYPATSLVVHQGRSIDNHWVMEITPRGKDSQDEADLEEKLKHFDRFFFGYPHSNECTKHVKETSLEVDRLFEKAMESSISSSSREVEFKPFSRSAIHVKSAIRYLIQSLFDELKNQGVIIEGKEPKTINDDFIPESIVSNINRCVFCNSQVIHNQFIFQGSYCVVLYNYLPWSEEHFMILPLAHKQHWNELSEGEKKELLRFVQVLTASIKEKKGNIEILVLLQNGVAAGQTVPHMHVHVVSSTTRFLQSVRLIKEMLGLNRPVSSEYMKQKENEYRDRIENKLGTAIGE